ncbi:unnamed protein product [Caenorhabditis angaria]|uniref:C-type lectin domain-containing protein n=1 Tax=Caenorhabditis angaria TaxID=860376 RepID=A0A9P1N8L1_9PELO|nr:unnamed protein product [Caenorhabditis angaria]
MMIFSTAVIAAFLEMLVFFGNVCDGCIPTQIVDVEDAFLVHNLKIEENNMIYYPTTTTTTTTTQTTTTTTQTTTTTTLIPSCIDSTWTLFDRDTYFWCMKAYIGATTIAQMSSNCQILNSAAVPTGFQNTEEPTTILTTTATGLRLWLGTYRNDACADVRLTVDCNEITSFHWTDGFTSGTDGFVWGWAQPDNSYLAQFYAVFLTSTGLMDDEFDDLTTEGVLCGMEANYT